MTVPKGECLSRSLANALVALEQRIKRLLVVDDFRITTDFISEMVRREFYGEVTTASSCKEANEIVRNSDPFDAVILDYSLANGPSIATYALIKAKCSDTKVVFLTGYDSPDLRRKVEEVGTARVHSKDAMSDLNFTRELLEEVGLKRRIEHADWAAGGI